MMSFLFRLSNFPLVPSKMRFFVTFLFLDQLSSSLLQGLKFEADSYFWSGFGDDFRQYDTKTVILCRFFVQTPLRNNAAMATPKTPGDQKLFESVCYMLKLKVTKFQLPRPNGF